MLYVLHALLLVRKSYTFFSTQIKKKCTLEKYNDITLHFLKNH